MTLIAQADPPKTRRCVLETAIELLIAVLDAEDEDDTDLEPDDFDACPAEDAHALLRFGGGLPGDPTDAEPEADDDALAFLGRC